MSDHAVDRSYVPTRAEGVLDSDVDGERLIWRQGRVRCLDPLASLVWTFFDGQSSIAEFSGDLAGAFGTSPRRVEADVARLCADLIATGYLKADPSVERPGFATEDFKPTLAGLVPRRRPPDDSRLDRLSFAHVTSRFRALEHDFAVRCSDGAVGRYLEDRLRAFAVPGRAASLYSIVDSGRDGPSRWSLYTDGIGIAAGPVAEEAVSYLFWHIHREVLQTARRHLVVHAGAVVTDDGCALALPGPMNAGKSTLTAGLVLAGCSYLSDELAAIHLESSWIDPYPRPLKVPRSGWGVLSELRPPEPAPGDPVERDMWHVDMSRLRPEVLGHRAPLGAVVVPRYEPDSPTQLVPISAAEAAEEIFRHALNWEAHGAAGFRAVVAAVAGTRCARLMSGSLTKAVDAVLTFVEGDKITTEG